MCKFIKSGKSLGGKVDNGEEEDLGARVLYSGTGDFFTRCRLRRRSNNANYTDYTDYTDDTNDTDDTNN